MKVSVAVSTMVFNQRFDDDWFSTVSGSRFFFFFFFACIMIRDCKNRHWNVGIGKTYLRKPRKKIHSKRSFVNFSSFPGFWRNFFFRRWLTVHQLVVLLQVWNTYSSSDNLAPLISRVLIGLHLSFCSLTSPTCSNSPRKCHQLNISRGKQLGFQMSHIWPQYMRAKEDIFWSSSNISEWCCSRSTETQL